MSKEDEMSQWVTTLEASEIIGVSRRRVLQLITDEKILHAKRLTARMWLVSRESIRDYLAAKK